MGASTAGVLSSESISYSQNLVLARHISPFINYINLYHGSYGFSKATPFGVWGVVLKRTEMFIFGGGLFTHALLGFVLPAGCPLA